MSEHNTEKSAEKSAEKKKERRKKRRRARQTADLSNDPEPVTALPSRPSAAAPAATELPGDGSVRRPLSAFDRPRPTLDEVPYEHFVSPRVYENVDSVSNPPRSPSTGRRTARIMIESDDDE